MGDDHNDSPALSKTEFWQRAAAVAFGLWALMLPLGVALVRDSVAELVKHDRDQADRLNNYILAMERRVSLIEGDRQHVIDILIDLREHDKKVDALMDRAGNGSRK